MFEHVVQAHAVKSSVRVVRFVERSVKHLQSSAPSLLDGRLTWVYPLGVHSEPSHSHDHLSETAADVEVLAAGDDEGVIEPAAAMLAGEESIHTRPVGHRVREDVVFRSIKRRKLLPGRLRIDERMTAAAHNESGRE